MQHGGETRAEEVESHDLRVGGRYLKYVVARHRKRSLVIDETARDRVGTHTPCVSERVGGWSGLANCAKGWVTTTWPALGPGDDFTGLEPSCL